MFIEENKERFSVTELVKLTGVSRSGYYYWLKTKTTRPSREELDRPLLEKMQILHRMNGGNIGRRRYKIDLLLHFGLTVNLKRIDRICRTYDLPLKTAKRAYRMATHEHHTVGNLMNRNFSALKPGLKFCMDITYIRAPKQTKFMYLCAIMDLYNGEIVASRVADHQRVELVLETLDELKEKDYIKGALIHTDQGTQFTSGVYMNRLKEMNLTPSMSRRGNCWDNACIESFFGKLKTEMYGFSTPHTKEQLIEAVHNYIYYYNHIRTQLKLKMSPVSYRLKKAGEDSKILIKEYESAA